MINPIRSNSALLKYDLGKLICISIQNISIVGLIDIYINVKESLTVSSFLSLLHWKKMRDEITFLFMI